MVPLYLVVSLYAAFGPAGPVSGARRLLWEDPKPMTIADWTWGPGGQERAPVQVAVLTALDQVPEQSLSIHGVRLPRFGYDRRMRHDANQTC